MIIVLIHGAWHGAWCWKYVAPLLTQAGHTVIAPDLPGHASNATDFKKITLQTYVEFVSDIVKAQTSPVMLVGHSLAGAIITQVAENLPECIEQLVYIAGYIPLHNESVFQQGQKSTSRGVTVITELDKDNNAIHLRNSSRVPELFYNCCSHAVAQNAMSMLQSEPLQPMLDVISITPERFGKVKKTYIECTEDKLITLPDQRRMSSTASCEVITITSDHSPFFSTVEKLVSTPPFEKGRLGGI